VTLDKRSRSNRSRAAIRSENVTGGSGGAGGATASSPEETGRCQEQRSCKGGFTGDWKSWDWLAAQFDKLELAAVKSGVTVLDQFWR
jgi:hypothetical protein